MMEAFDAIDEIRSSLLNGDMCVFPTDTIYGVGVDARNEKALIRLRQIKKRWGKPYSIIAPSRDWIDETFETSGKKAWLDRLPGAYTLILKPKHMFSTQLSNGNVGIRIPDHPISTFVSSLGFAIVATSVNQAGMEPLTHFEQFKDPRYADFECSRFAIEDGVLDSDPSTVIDLTGERPVYVRM